MTVGSHPMQRMFRPPFGVLMRGSFLDAAAIRLTVDRMAGSGDRRHSLAKSQWQHSVSC